MDDNTEQHNDASDVPVDETAARQPPEDLTAAIPTVSATAGPPAADPDSTQPFPPVDAASPTVPMPAAPPSWTPAGDAAPQWTPAAAAPPWAAPSPGAPQWVQPAAVQPWAPATDPVPWAPYDQLAATPPEGTPPAGAGDTPPLGVPPAPARTTPYAQPLMFPPSGPTGGPGAGGPSWPPPPYGYGGWYGPPPVPELPRRSRRGVALLLVGALVAGGVGAGLGAAFTTNSSNNALSQPPSGSDGPSNALSTAVITKLVSPAVVDIDTVVATPSDEPQQQAAGTGMIVSSNGIILTNNHVVEGALKISVMISGHSYPATVLGTAESSDVALVKVTGVTGLPTVSLGNSSAMQVGDPVVAIGNALGLGGSSSAPGYISRLGSTINASSEDQLTKPETLHGLFETNAEIQPGDSGGPLVNGRGQVIGMDTAAAQGDNGSSVGFAIPIATARAIALKIENHKASGGIVLGLSPYLGVFVDPAGITTTDGLGAASTTCANGTTGNGGTSATKGLTLFGVASGGPGALAGLAAGDVLTSIGGTSITSQNDVTKAASNLKPGEPVAIAYTDPCGAAHMTTVTLSGIPA